MLSSHAIEQSFTLAETLANNGIILEAKPATVLSELTNVTFMDKGLFDGYSTDDLLDGGAFLNILSSNLRSNNNGVPEQPSQHDIKSDVAIKSLSQLLIGQVNFLREQIKPVIIDFSDKVKVKIDSVPFTDPSSSFNILVKDIPPFIDGDFINHIKKFNTDLSYPEPCDYFENESPENIISFLYTGLEEYDAGIRKWVENTGTLFFTNIWSNFFTQTNETPSTYFGEQEILSSDIYTKIDIGLVLYLICNRLLNDQTMKNSFKSVREYENRVSSLRNFGVSLLLSGIKFKDAYENTQTVIVSSNHKLKTISVVGPLYRKWLSEGGKPELLLATLIKQGQQLKTVDEINNNITELNNAWTSYQFVSEQDSLNKRLSVFKNAVITTYVEMFKSPTELENKYKVITGEQRFENQTNKELDTILEQVTLDDLKDLFAFSIKVICRTRFYYTPAEQILTNMYGLSKSSNYNPEELAFLSVVKYLVKYLVESVNVKKINV